MPRSFYSRQNSPITIAEDFGRAWGQVWSGAENLIRNGIRTPNRPTSKSLYRVRYAKLILLQYEDEHVTEFISVINQLDVQNGLMIPDAV